MNHHQNSILFGKTLMTTDESKNRPPRYTVSCGLLIHTMLIFILVIVGYFFWYQRLPAIVIPDERPRMTVTIMDDWGKILQNLKDDMILELEPGKYVDSIITSRKKVTIQSKNPQKPAELVSSNNAALTFDQCMECDLHNLIITSQSAWPAISLQSCNNIKLQQLNIVASQIAVRDHLGKSDCITIENSKIQGRLQFKACENVTIRSNFIQFASDTAMSLEDISGLAIEDNQILQSGNALIFANIKPSKLADKINRISHNMLGSKASPITKGGIWIQDSRNKLEVFGNIVSTKQGPALQLSNCSNVQLDQWKRPDAREPSTGNQPVPGQPSSALPLPGQPGQPAGALPPPPVMPSPNFIRNHFYSRQGPAMFVLDSTEITLANSIYENESSDDYAVMLENSTIKNMFGNEIRGTTKLDQDGHREEINGGGILIHGSNVTLTQNNIQYSSHAGIRIENDSKVKLSGNQILEVEKDGIQAEKSIVEIGFNNLIQENQKVGIYLKKCKGVIEGSRIYKNKKDGIFLEDSSPVITSNLIAANGANGLSLDSKSLPKVSLNDFSENAQYGIDVGSVAKIDWRNNVFSNNKLGQCNDPTAKNNPAPNKAPTSLTPVLPAESKPPTQSNPPAQSKQPAPGNSTPPPPFPPQPENMQPGIPTPPEPDPEPAFPGMPAPPTTPPSPSQPDSPSANNTQPNPSDPTKADEWKESLDQLFKDKKD